MIFKAGQCFEVFALFSGLSPRRCSGDTHFPPRSLRPANWRPPDRKERRLRILLSRSTEGCIVLCFLFFASTLRSVPVLFPGRSCSVPRSVPRSLSLFPRRSFPVPRLPLPCPVSPLFLPLPCPFSCPWFLPPLLSRLLSRCFSRFSVPSSRPVSRFPVPSFLPGSVPSPLSRFLSLCFPLSFPSLFPLAPSRLPPRISHPSQFPLPLTLIYCLFLH